MTAVSRCVFKSAAVLIGLIAGVLLVELILNLFFFQPVGRIATDGIFIDSPFPDIGYEYRPNSSYLCTYGKPSFLKPPLQIQVDINSYGIRGPEFSVDKKTGVYRVLVIGDSCTYGLGVKVEDSYPSQLQKLLQEKAGDSALIEVINGGVEGYNMAQCAAWFLNRGRPLNPDLLIWAFNTNDMESRAETHFGTGSESAGKKAFKDLELSIALLPPLSQQSLTDHIKMNSQIYRLILRSRKQYALGPALSRSKGAILETHVRSVREACETDDVSICSILLPDMHRKQNLNPKSSTWFAETCRNNQIPVISLLSSLSGSDILEYYVHPCDPHPNAGAHRIFAQNIAKALLWQDSRLVFVENHGALEDE